MSSNSSNIGPEVQFMLFNQRRKRAMEIVKKSILTLGFHNGVLQFFATHLVVSVN